MSDKSLQISEQALRLGLAVAALGLAAWLARPAAGRTRLSSGPRPAVVQEW